jgi:hypothetical protein
LLLDGGGLVLREVEKRIGILQQFAAFTDYRNPDLIEHPVKEWWPKESMGWPWDMKI